MYTVNVPSYGWRREKIEPGKSWQGNLGEPFVTVTVELDKTHRLSVVLVETRGGIEIDQAEIEEWQREDDAPNGGFWVPGRPIPSSQIQLVS